MEKISISIIESKIYLIIISLMLVLAISGCTRSPYSIIKQEGINISQDDSKILLYSDDYTKISNLQGDEYLEIEILCSLGGIKNFLKEFNRNSFNLLPFKSRVDIPVSQINKVSNFGYYKLEASDNNYKLLIVDSLYCRVYLFKYYL